METDHMTDLFSLPYINTALQPPSFTFKPLFLNFEDT